MKKILLNGLTHRAKLRIDASCRACKEQTGKDPIPAIVWLEAKMNDNRVQDGIAIAFYYEEQRDEIASDIQAIDGFEIVLAISLEHEMRFHNKTLDFDGNNYRLIG